MCSWRSVRLTGRSKWLRQDGLRIAVSRGCAAGAQCAGPQMLVVLPYSRLIRVACLSVSGKYRKLLHNTARRCFTICSSCPRSMCSPGAGHSSSPSSSQVARQLGLYDHRSRFDSLFSAGCRHKEQKRTMVTISLGWYEQSSAQSDLHTPYELGYMS